jgi:hypothetical protein
MPKKYHYTKKTGRPTSYNREKFKKKLEEYLQKRQDHVEVVTNKRGGVSRIYQVRLPTIEGFIAYLGHAKRTIYDWRAIHSEVDEALERIKQEQLQRLIDEGLGGYYNPTITKLILSANHGMKEEISTEISGEVTNKFDDRQIDRIAERIAARGRSNGDSSSEEKSN